ncbi:Mechanosensitive ion channel protein [Pseudomonas syringae pv. delphinii]|uniref:Mechanosensitive ion channel protein n=1 Tax=Pseudomonas syringae pv. delphinii TaxID=192088 RepID=A0A0P9Q7J4_9PSED|nr:MscS mechanosensitive ion channel [Pseudomonas syringae pv. delphinii]RMP13046.1 MscS mechanosensitive ion channel [Pseudomonas syringae pv. delphinii]RMP15957.1 Mechanosensitive ion channel protein [Pseudomonas syringae pv. delphinii]RMQ17500.1 Mechanosensitive ion channel protein [Pseudomonas syringae pv. delphinii]
MGNFQGNIFNHQNFGCPEIMDAFAEMDVRFAFPSRTVYVASLPPVKTSRHTALEAADANA